MRIETERLVLRPFERRDEAALAPLLGDLEVMEFSDAGPLDAAARAAWLGRAMAGDRNAAGFFAIVGKEAGALAGYVSLTANQERICPGEQELGFRLVRAYWGRGIASEAIRALLGASVVGEATVVALVDPGNTRSLAALHRLGFSHIRDVMLEGYDYPDRVYALPARLTDTGRRR